MSISLKATAIALIASISLTTFAAMPSQAADPMLTELKLDLGLTADMVERGKTLQADMVKFGYGEDEVDDWCVNNRQIRNSLIRAGFDDMDVVDRLTQFRVRVEALYLADGWIYSMLVNRCTGEVTVLSPIYASADRR